MATKFAKNTNPWTGERPVKLQKIIDPTTLEICNDPLPIARSTPEGKYTGLFSKLKHGQALKCPPGAAPKIATALKKWLEVNNKPGTVRSALRYGEDGTGRVWLLEPENPSSTPIGLSWAGPTSASDMNKRN
jgi:hypothetical protein